MNFCICCYRAPYTVSTLICHVRVYATLGRQSHALVVDTRRFFFFFFFTCTRTHHILRTSTTSSRRRDIPAFWLVLFFFSNFLHYYFFLFLPTFPSSFCFYLLLVRLPPVSRSQSARSSRRAYISRVETRQSKLTGISQSKNEKTKTPICPPNRTRRELRDKTTRVVPAVSLAVHYYCCLFTTVIDIVFVLVHRVPEERKAPEAWW